MGRLVAERLGLAALGDVLEGADEALRLAVLRVDEPAEADSQRVSPSLARRMRCSEA
jgi:hypothetical protein